MLYDTTTNEREREREREREGEIPSRKAKTKAKEEPSVVVEHTRVVLSALFKLLGVISPDSSSHVDLGLEGLGFKVATALGVVLANDSTKVSVSSDLFSERTLVVHFLETSPVGPKKRQSKRERERERERERRTRE